MSSTILLSGKVNENEWNLAVAAGGVQGTVSQTTHWAEFLKESYRDRPIYITVLERARPFLPDGEDGY